MPRRRKPDLADVTFVAVTMLFLATIGCRKGARPGDGDLEPAGEPVQYSATVVRLVEHGTIREISTSREARSGDQRRDEWTEEGRSRALIWKPDIGKAFLLDLDRRVYVEIEITPGLLPENLAGPGNPHNVSAPKNAAKADSGDGFVQSIERYFDDRQPPGQIERRVLSPVIIEGRSCAVSEQRAVFADGHAETTRSFRARDLSGLALRVECEDEQGSAKVTTERRDVRLEVAPDAFVVPADFKRAERLPL